MSVQKPAKPTDSDRPKPPPGGRVVVLRAAVGWLVAVVLGAGFGVGFASAYTVAQVAGALLGVLLAVLVATAMVVISGRIWPLFPAFLLTGLCIVSVMVASQGYLARYGTRFTATTVSAECHGVKGGIACTARLRGPDGAMLDGDIPTSTPMDVGETVEVAADPAGIMPVHAVDELDPDGLPAGMIMFGAAAILLAGLFALAAWLGIRRPRPLPASRKRSGRTPAREAAHVEPHDGRESR